MEPLEMHYAMKQKLNRADSQQLRDLRPEEMDWYLNEGQLQYIKTVANPKQQFIVEANQRMMDDIAPLVTTASFTSLQTIDGRKVMLPMYELEPRFMYYIGAEAVISNGCCSAGKRAKVFIRRHSDLFPDNRFYRSSWQWSEVSAVFEGDGDGACLVMYNDADEVGDAGAFAIDSVDVSYIHVPRMIFCGGYSTIDGSLTASDDPQSCELPFHVHEDIVDIAAMLAASNLMNPDIQAKIQKIQMNNN